MSQNTEMPYLTAALIAERALHEKDGTISLIRLVDTLTTTVIGSEAAEATEPIAALKLAFFLAFRAGPARGKREAFLVLYNPTGTRVIQAGPYPMVFTSEEQGYNGNIELTLALKEEGIYWLEVVMAGQILSRVPMVLHHVIQSPEQNKPASETPNAAE